MGKTSREYLPKPSGARSLPPVANYYVRRLKESPSLCKEVDGHPIYQSAADFDDLRKSVGLLKISNFGAAPHCHDIQPQQFCAPEVLLKAKWTYSADIWNLGMVVRASGFEIAIRAMPLTLTPWQSCGSFYKTLHSSMGLGLKATSTLAKPISLR